MYISTCIHVYLYYLLVALNCPKVHFLKTKKKEGLLMLMNTMGKNFH